MASASWIGTAIGLRISSPPATTASSYSNRRWEVNPAIGAGLDAPRPNRGSSESASALGRRPLHRHDRAVARHRRRCLHSGRLGGGLWLREVIGTEFEGGHALIAVDLNDDDMTRSSREAEAEIGP